MNTWDSRPTPVILEDLPRVDLTTGTDEAHQGDMTDTMTDAAAAADEEATTTDVVEVTMTVIEVDTVEAEKEIMMIDVVVALLPQEGIMMIEILTGEMIDMLLLRLLLWLLLLRMKIDTLLQGEMILLLDEEMTGEVPFSFNTLAEPLPLKSSMKTPQYCLLSSS